MEKSEHKRITYAVFIFSCIIIIINLISLFFPALLLTFSIGSQSNINPFELGAWTIPFFSINFTILVFGVLYFKQLLPNAITKSFKFLLDFEVSRRITTIVFLIIVGIYIIITAGELNQREEDRWGDWEILGPIIKNFPYGGDETPELNILYVNNFLLYSSEFIFHNVKIIPFIGSLSLIFLVYFLTVQISRKRFAGLVAMVILLQSHTFLRYDTTATYANFWTVFYLASLYLIYTRWPLSALAFVASVFSKALVIAFIPMTLFFALRSDLKTKTKIGIIILYGIIIIATIMALFAGEGLGYSKTLTEFDGIDFVSGFTSWAFQLRIDGLVLIFLLPVTVGLFIKSLNGKQEADSILVLIAGILLSVPLLAGFTQYNIQPYRWIPLIVFFAIGVGTLLSKSADGSED